MKLEARSTKFETNSKSQNPNTKRLGFRIWNLDIVSDFGFRISDFRLREGVNGFTLLETIIAVSIVILIGTGAMVSFVNSRNVRDLNTSGQNVLSVLREAQSKAIAGEDNVIWGVRLEQARFILFAGPAFSGSPTTTIHTLPSSIEIVNISLAGGGQEIVFERIDGRTNKSGTFDVRVRQATNFIFPITIDSSGKVYQTGTAPAVLGTRILDTRHRQFNLGWSIQGYNTMTLRFADPPNPDTVQNIAMAAYFGSNPTRFDWFGTTVVGGQNQVLRIHTTFLDGANTTLSVDRDCRYNTKQVKITFDTRDVATYLADCQTVTVEAYGGVISEP